MDLKTKVVRAFSKFGIGPRREDSGLSGDSSTGAAGGEKRFEIPTSGINQTDETIVNGKHQKMDPNDQTELEKLIELEQHRSGSIGGGGSLRQQMTGSPATMADAPEISTTVGSIDYQLDGHYLPDNVEIQSISAHGGKLKSWRSFLISFLVDARGGAMRGCRHSGVRIIIPPRKAPMPMRITCRYLKKEKLVHPPPLSEGEALASRILEMGPAGAKFLGPVILEIPHFASLKNREREIMIVRSDDGEHWKEHQLEATEDAVQEVLNESFDPEELSQLDDLNTTRITRILTSDFPQYFAVVTRIRQEVHAVGPEGGMIGSTVVPQVKALFPDGALTKTIKVSLQAQPIPQELITKLHGSQVAVSPVVTVEPRRRKFHKPITLCIPLPQSTQKQLQQQLQQQQGPAVASGSGSPAPVPATSSGQESEQQMPPTLRLLCSITGGTTPAKWEDITGTTQLAFSPEHVSFTTTVSARFWLMDCPTPREAARMAQEIYNEAVLVPYMAKFVVFGRRSLPNEWQLRVFCMTDDKEDKTLERQEHYSEIAKSRDVEVLASRQQYVEFGGNITPIVKPGEPLTFKFIPFQENRLMFSLKKKDSEPADAPAAGRIAFMKEAKHRGEGAPHAHQHPICTLAITLPNFVSSISADRVSTSSHSSSLSRKYRFTKASHFETIFDTNWTIQDLAHDLAPENWEHVGRVLSLPNEDLQKLQRQFPGQEILIVLRIWHEGEGSQATKENLVEALRKLGREDLIQKWFGQKFQNGNENGISADDESDAKKARI